MESLNSNSNQFTTDEYITIIDTIPSTGWTNAISSSLKNIYVNKVPSLLNGSFASSDAVNLLKNIEFTSNKMKNLSMSEAKEIY